MSLAGSTLLTSAPPDLSKLPGLTQLNLKHSEWFSSERDPWGPGCVLRLPCSIETLDVMGG